MKILKFLKHLSIIVTSFIGISISNNNIYGSKYYIAFNETYGGDAYTGIQNAAADTANNVRLFALEAGSYFELLTTIFALAFLIIIFQNIEPLICTAKDIFIDFKNKMHRKEENKTIENL